MKISRKQTLSPGSALIFVLVTTAILTGLMASYLALTSAQSQSVFRSGCWNGALPMAEAGIEEGLTHMTKNLTNFAADGWTRSGTNYTLRRTLGDGYYDVTISGTGILSKVTSTGYQGWRDSNYLSRTVQVKTRIFRYKQIGLVARGISFGGDLNADSYDSLNQLYNTGGAYDSAKATDQVTIATPSPGFDLGGNATVRGYLATGPGGAVAWHGSTTVGDMSYKAKGIQAGHQTNGFTLNLEDVELPIDSGITPVSGSVNGTTYNYVLNAGIYMIGNLNAGGSGTTMSVSGASLLLVTGNISLSSITFEPGARLDLYIATPAVSFAPKLINGRASQFWVWGLPSCKSMTLSSGTVFTGVIYAPEVDFVANGHASFCGALTANTFACNGTFDFHYDVDTGRPFTLKPVTIFAWSEL